jgi:hypothetical protein
MGQHTIVSLAHTGNTALQTLDSIIKVRNSIRHSTDLVIDGNDLSGQAVHPLSVS